MSRSRKSNVAFRPTGELTIYRAVEHFEALRAAVGAKPSTVRIDLSEVSEVDSAGLQLLLQLRKTLEAQGA